MLLIKNRSDVTRLGSRVRIRSKVRHQLKDLKTSNLPRSTTKTKRKTVKMLKALMMISKSLRSSTSLTCVMKTMPRNHLKSLTTKLARSLMMTKMIREGSKSSRRPSPTSPCMTTSSKCGHRRKWSASVKRTQVRWHSLPRHSRPI